MFMLMEEIDPLLDRGLGMLDVESKSGRRKAKKNGSEDA